MSRLEKTCKRGELFISLLKLYEEKTLNQEDRESRQDALLHEIMKVGTREESSSFLLSELVKLFDVPSLPWEEYSRLTRSVEKATGESALWPDAESEEGKKYEDEYRKKWEKEIENSLPEPEITEAADTTKVKDADVFGTEPEITFPESDAKGKADVDTDVLREGEGESEVGDVPVVSPADGERIQWSAIIALIVLVLSFGVLLNFQAKKSSDGDWQVVDSSVPDTRARDQAQVQQPGLKRPAVDGKEISDLDLVVITQEGSWKNAGLWAAIEVSTPGRNFKRQEVAKLLASAKAWLQKNPVSLDEVLVRNRTRELVDEAGGVDFIAEDGTFEFFNEDSRKRIEDYLKSFR